MRIPRSYGRGLAVLGLLLPAAVALTAGTPAVALTAGTPAVAQTAGTPAALTAATGRRTPDLVWDRLADCESDGDWQADTGNGYYGGLQIWPPTWREAGGLRYADRPDHAARRQQITVAEEVLRRQGWQAWGGCAREIGVLEPDAPEPDAPE
ncbi:transglycosylase family protein [Kitasatospora phosalacinea]|uniref:transglycosylase family protein n=1 Tax=Kitasatospora phosalacinea TaxID=2065 RepID=UPI00364E4958